MTDVKYNGIKVYLLLVGMLYLLLGSLQAIFGFGLDIGLSDILLLPEDGIGGLVLVVIGFVFFLGFFRSSKYPNEGVSFAFVGTAMGLFFSAVYVLILLADVFEAKVLVSEDWEGWTILDSIRPGLYLGVLTLIGYIIWRKGHFSKKSKA